MKTAANVLHLSDIHRTPEEPLETQEILHGIKADLARQRDEGLPSPDVVVISGDITQETEPNEYKEAKDLIEGLLDELSLNRSRLVIVPGNHDVRWESCYDAFQLRPNPPAGIEREYCVETESGEWLCASSEAAYLGRLANFREFYFDLCGEEYPEPRENQFAIKRFDSLGIAFAAMNSCDLVDHKRFRGQINVSALADAATALNDFEGVRVAIWHHDLDWRGDGCCDTLDPGSLRLISERVFHLGLCGHTHRPASHDVVNIAGCPLPVVAAGSLCAGERQRPESVPRSFNLIEISRQAARVHVRVRDERTTPWKRQLFDDKSGPKTSFNVSLSSGDALSDHSQKKDRQDNVARAPSPFGGVNAKSAAREQVVQQYVWTDVAKSVDTDEPQIVLGPRGSGKTALLLSLTFEGRARSPEHSNSPQSVLSLLGLLCPMNIGDITAFNSKGWMPIAQRERLFMAMLTTLWAQELVSTIKKVGPWSRSNEIECPSDTESAQLLSQLWIGDQPSVRNLDDIRLYVKTFRNRVLEALSVYNPQERSSCFSKLSTVPLFHRGTGLLSDTAGELQRWECFKFTKWALLFDEVEFLSETQQTAVYSLLGQPSEILVTKIATRPYAHARAVDNTNPRLVEGNDFHELILSFTSELELRAPDEGTTKNFEDVANGIWTRRLEGQRIKAIPLDEVWEDFAYAEVIALASTELPQDRDSLELALIADLSDTARARASELRESDRKKFLDQYWRRYLQPFRYRLASDAASKYGLELPLVWGCRALLRACDGNCRWFLRLADECWRLYWSVDGLRPLSAYEQYAAIRNLSDSICRPTGSLTECGPELKTLIERVASEFSIRIVKRSSLVEEALTVEAKDLSDSQANAIAVGVAYGLIVPKLVVTDRGSLFYPTKDVELRLGFPVAVHKELPLRSGTTLKISNLRQVQFPWMKE